MVRYIILLFMLAGFQGKVMAQTYQEALVSMVEMLQYQRAKSKDNGANAPFKKYGMKRIKASKVLSDDDPRRIWGFHLHANLEYDKQREPLYKLFKRSDFGSMAVIDYFSPDELKCELVFWGKKYYRRFAHELRRMGFEIRNSRSQTNMLEFRKEGVSVGVNAIIWPDIYILQTVNVE